MRMVGGLGLMVFSNFIELGSLWHWECLTALLRDYLSKMLKCKDHSTAQPAKDTPHTPGVPVGFYWDKQKSRLYQSFLNLINSADCCVPMGTYNTTNPNKNKPYWNICQLTECQFSPSPNVFKILSPHCSLLSGTGPLWLGTLEFYPIFTKQKIFSSFSFVSKKGTVTCFLQVPSPKTTG